MLLPKLTVKQLRQVALVHNVHTNTKMNSQNVQDLISNHICQSCKIYVTILQCIDKQAIRDANKKAVQKYQANNKEKN